MNKVSSNDTRTLNKFLQEENDFKRFILCQLWISQVFSDTINHDIIREINPENGKEPLTNEGLYKIFQNIKQSLATENDRLKEIEVNLSNQRDVANALNEVFELGLTKEVEVITKRLIALREKIGINEDYMEKIKSLSETKIEELRNVKSSNN